MEVTWKAGDVTEISPEIGRAIAESNSIRVTAVVEARESRAEAMQCLVSQWSPAGEWGAFDAFDASAIDGLQSIGYFGAVFDGRYVYFSPEQKNRSQTHGVVLRYDTHADFKDRKSYAAYDASLTSGIPTRGYYGAAFDGRYVYFVPRQLDMREYHTHVLRYDTHRDFKDPAAWQARDAGEKHSSQGSAFDGRFLYFCPGFSGDPKTESVRSGQVLRLDTQGAFNDPGSYKSFGLSRFLGEKATCFDGGAFDGRYIYFVPIETNTVVRFDTHANFESPAAWQSFDGKQVGVGINVGLVFDGRYMYCCAYAHGTIVRFDTTMEFVDPASWNAYRADSTSGLATIGFDGGFFDGRFVHFVPFVRPGSGQKYIFHTNFLRYDTAGDFNDPASWDARDSSQTDGLRTIGYNAGAFDGRYFYAAPWQQGPNPDGSGPMIHGNVLRYDTLGDNGTFSLRYCDYGHNGGLCAAVPGPSFLVNTYRGCVSVAGHKALSPGRHELEGIYDGRAISLHIDGRLIARRDRVARIQPSAVPITIGSLSKGLGRFAGHIQQVVISSETVPSRR